MPLDRDMYERVCRVLWETWDPIGVNQLGGPDDEYDSYAASIIRMIHEGAEQTRVVEHLGKIARVSMGLSHIDEVRDRVVAKRLIELVGTGSSGRRE